MTEAEELRERVEKIYADLRPLLDPEHGHCREVAIIAYHLAVARGLAAARCHGWRKLEPAARDAHAWLRLDDGRILHSPSVGVVELRQPSSPDEFDEEWRAGPPTPRRAPAARTFSVGRR